MGVAVRRARAPRRGGGTRPLRDSSAAAQQRRAVPQSGDDAGPLPAGITQGQRRAAVGADVERVLVRVRRRGGADRGAGPRSEVAVSLQHTGSSATSGGPRASRLWSHSGSADRAGSDRSITPFSAPRAAAMRPAPPSRRENVGRMATPSPSRSASAAFWRRIVVRAQTGAGVSAVVDPGSRDAHPVEDRRARFRCWLIIQ